MPDVGGKGSIKMWGRRAFLWERIQEERADAILYSLPQHILEAWGQRAGLESYWHSSILVPAQLCTYPSEFEILLKKESGNWSKYRWFWWYALSGVPLVEAMMRELRNLDTYTSDFDERIAMRLAYLRQLEANVLGYQMMR